MATMLFVGVVGQLASVAAGAREQVPVASKAPQIPSWPREPEQPGAPRPAAAPTAIKALVGEYAAGADRLYVIEDGGRACFILNRERAQCAEVFRQAPVFRRGATGQPTSVVLAGVTYTRQQVGPIGGGQLKITPVRPVRALVREARAALPPDESGEFLKTDLVEVVTLDRTVKLDIRYATTNNFLGNVFYSQARAFLQRPAAEAVIRAHQALAALGYGLLIHDGYRPWYVTKAFWDATPDETKWLVANPANGSRHNRGAAVDLTLYDLKTGRVIEMPSTYDESTPRAYAFYPGGTSLQRWHRALLRQVMEREGFVVNPEEWWHFDFGDWRKYRIGNVPFEELR